MKTHLALAASLFISSVSFADVGEVINSFTTLSGRTYRGVLIAGVNPDGVLFRHASGAGKVLFSDLPADLRQALGYDAKKAEAYEKELAARRERERLARIERDKEIAKAQASASLAAAAQANAARAEYELFASQGGGYGSDMGYPVVWGFGGGGGWYTDRVASPSYGGRAFYNVTRRVGSVSQGGRPFSAGRAADAGPYSPGHVGNAKFINGVPALNASFVPGHNGARQSGVRGTSSAPVTGCLPAAPLAGRAR